MSATYEVEIYGVREVGLLGTAEPAFWRRHLAEYRLEPTISDDRAAIMISACDGRFRGIRFQELSISVLTESARNDGNSAFLVQAFNSRRLFAWVERTFFCTPYDFAGIEVEVGPPATIDLTVRDQTVFRALMHQPVSQAIKNVRSASIVQQDGWEGTIYLPRLAHRPRDPFRLFRGKLSGVTHYYDFDASDRVLLNPSKAAPVSSWLIESDYRPKQWIIRPDATHAKSKTTVRPGEH